MPRVKLKVCEYKAQMLPLCYAPLRMLEWTFAIVKVFVRSVAGFCIQRKKWGKLVIKEMCPSEKEMRPKILIAALAARATSAVGLCVSFFFLLDNAARRTQEKKNLAVS